MGREICLCPSLVITGEIDQLVIGSKSTLIRLKLNFERWIVCIQTNLVFFLSQQFVFKGG